MVHADLECTFCVQDIIEETVHTYGMAVPRTFVRVAGLSGAMAVGIGAYGAHGKSSVQFQISGNLHLFRD